MRMVCVIAVGLGVTAAAAAQDKVQFRERGAKGAVQQVTGKIESESIAGVRIGNRLISGGDIIDVQYEVPALIRLDYPRAVAAEAKSPADGIREYEDLLKSPAVQAARPIKRQFEFKVAMLAAARADEQPEAAAKAIELIGRYRKEHADSWQVIPLVRAFVRLNLQKEPPDVETARKALSELAATPNVPPEVRIDSILQSVDLLLAAGKVEEARRELAGIPVGDPRAQIYEIGCNATPTTIAESVRQLEAIIEQTPDRAIKAAAYNMIGDCYRRDPKTKKDALYAYLWVDVVYNDDPIETAKAIGRLADLFAELKDDDRARKYRERLRGRG